MLPCKNGSHKEEQKIIGCVKEKEENSDLPLFSGTETFCLPYVVASLQVVALYSYSQLRDTKDTSSLYEHTACNGKKIFT